MQLIHGRQEEVAVNIVMCLCHCHCWFLGSSDNSHDWRGCCFSPSLVGPIDSVVRVGLFHTTNIGRDGSKEGCSFFGVWSCHGGSYNRWSLISCRWLVGNGKDFCTIPTQKRSNPNWDLPPTNDECREPVFQQSQSDGVWIWVTEYDFSSNDKQQSVVLTLKLDISILILTVNVAATFGSIRQQSLVYNNWHERLGRSWF